MRLEYSVKTMERANEILDAVDELGVVGIVEKTDRGFLVTVCL